MKTTAISRFHEHIEMETNILESYVNRVEQDISKGIEAYKNNIETVHEEEHIHDNQSFYQSVEVCEGLDSMTFSFESVFEEYFPRLQRSSALIVLCSFHEDSLINFCNELQTERSVKIGVNDINGKGVEAAITYLNKVFNCNIDKGGKEYNAIKNIQHIRNSFAHQAGKNNSKTESFVLNNQYLSSNNYINIGEGFLNFVLKSYKEFLLLTHDSINN